MLEARDRVGGRAPQHGYRRRAERARRPVGGAVPERRCTSCSTSSGSSSSTAHRERRSRLRRRRPGQCIATTATTRRSRTHPPRAYDDGGRRSSTRSSRSSTPRRRGRTRAPPSSTRSASSSGSRAEVDDTLARDLLRAFMAGGYMTKPADTFSLLGALATIAGAGSVDEPVRARPLPQLPCRRWLAADSASARRAARRPRRPRRSGARRCAGRDDGVELEAGADRVTAARAAIVAVPPNVAGLIRFEPALPAWRMRLHQALTQGDVIKVLAVYEEPFWRVGRARRRGLRAVPTRPRGVRQHAARRRGPASSAPSSPPRARRRPSGSTPTSAARLVLEGMAAFFGSRALAAVDVIELDWSQEEWTRGAYAATFGVGGLSRYGPDLTPARGADPLGVHRPRRRRPHAHGRRDPLRSCGRPSRARPQLSAAGASLTS